MDYRDEDDVEVWIADLVETAKDSQRNAKRVQNILMRVAQRVKKTKASDNGSASVKYFNPHEKSYINFGDSAMAIMLFMDIVDYSRRETDEELKECTDVLNNVVLEALRKAGCDLDDVICLPSGDGMCLCFRDHKKPLKVAVHIHEGLRKGDIKLRMGIHHGGISRVTDLKGWHNLSGDAINLTQRTMDFGDEHHILCTEEAFKLFKRMRDDRKLFKPLGKCLVKHGVELSLFNYCCDIKKVGNPKDPQKKSALPPRLKTGLGRKRPIETEPPSQ